MRRQPWYTRLYWQVLIGVALGILAGWAYQHFQHPVKPAEATFVRIVKALSDGFINLVKMIIAPIVFCTIVHGVASMRDLKKLGRVGAKTLLYFEVISTFALVIGLVVVNVVKPGANFQQPLPAGAATAVQAIEQKAQGHDMIQFFLGIIPGALFEPFVSGNLLQVLLVAGLVAVVISRMGDRGKPALHVIETISHVLFGIMDIVVKLAPIGAFGAMAFTVASYGAGSLKSLLALMLTFYATAILFVVFVLGAVARLCGFSILRFLAYIKDELLLVLGTSSSETALPGMVRKMEQLGCKESTVGLVIPTGYSFNLDGTNLYMAMGAMFLAQATGTHLSLHQQVMLLVVAMLTSKGASGVTGAGFICLAATLAACKDIPIESMALLVGIDRFMSGCRALTNLIGNGVATVAISRWENELTAAQLRANLGSLRTAGGRPAAAHVNPSSARAT